MYGYIYKYLFISKSLSLSLSESDLCAIYRGVAYGSHKVVSRYYQVCIGPSSFMNCYLCSFSFNFRGSFNRALGIYRAVQRLH